MDPGNSITRATVCDEGAVHRRDRTRYYWPPVAIPLREHLECRLFSGIELATCLAAIESWLVRRWIAKTPGGPSNHHFYEGLSNRISGIEAPTEFAKAIVEELSSAPGGWPDDHEVVAEAKNHGISQTARKNTLRLKRILIEIERQYEGKHAHKNPLPRLEIEHVMPKSGDLWPTHDRKAVWMLGNLTLVPSEINRCLSNKPWSKKRAKLEESMSAEDNHDALFLTKHLLEGVGSRDCDWNKKEIRCRSSELARVICCIWPDASHFRTEARHQHDG